MTVCPKKIKFHNISQQIEGTLYIGKSPDFAAATIAANFINFADRGQFCGINALITTQERVQWRMDIGGWSWEIYAAKVCFSEGLGISGLSVGCEDFTIIEFEILLTWRPLLMISVFLPELVYHLHISKLGKL